MKFEESFLQDLESISWFSNLGNDFEYDKEKIIKLESWEECEASFLEPNWEDTTLEMRNVTTSFLSKNEPTCYTKWNELLKNGQDFLKTQIMPKIEKLDLPFDEKDTFYACVRWDLLGCLMENVYRQYKAPRYFTNYFLDVYKQGHFPCGWEGEWPAGKLIVF